MIVGDPSRFAIESNITEFCGSPSQVGVGFFVVHVQGKSYGIRSPKATMLGLSLETVSQFIAQRGTHRLPMGMEPDSRLLADSILASMYNPHRQQETFFGIPAERLNDLVGSLDWHSGGDEAFDDSSHIFHFDIDDRVRVLACKNLDHHISCLSDLWMDADEFYQTLNTWKQEFQEQIATGKIG